MGLMNGWTDEWNDEQSDKVLLLLTKTKNYHVYQVFENISILHIVIKAKSSINCPDFFQRKFQKVGKGLEIQNYLKCHTK